MSVLYAEVPGFYAEVERVADPALRGRIVLVGGDPRKSGTVQSATREALERGVVPGMPILEALEHCPGAKLLRTDMRRYRETAARLRTALRRFVDRLEPAGLGAAYLDSLAAARPPEELAQDLCKRVDEELGLPLRVGISEAKFLARLAAEEAGERVLRIPTGEEARFLAPLGVERLPGVGPATAASLAELGATRVGELARLERAHVESRLGSHGHTIWELAHGRDHSPVRPSAHPKSLSQESSFPAEELDSAAILARLQDLAEGLSGALAREELRARRVTLKLRYADQERISRSRTVETALGSAAEIHGLAASLLERTQAGSRPVRGVGIVLARLTPERREDQQLDLFGGR